MVMDEQDYVAFLSGDNSGFERLVLRYKDGLIYYINRMVCNLAAAEDLAQDVFVEVYVHKEGFQPEKASFKTYLYTIGHHKSVDYVRKAKREQPTDFLEGTEFLTDEEDAPESFLLKKEEQRELWNAIGSLKAEYRQILVLTELEGMKQKDAAAVLGKTLPQAKVLAHRARKALKQALTVRQER